jgi:hypothetical protein
MGDIMCSNKTDGHVPVYAVDYESPQRVLLFRTFGITDKQHQPFIEGQVKPAAAGTLIKRPKKIKVDT